MSRVALLCERVLIVLVSNRTPAVLLRSVNHLRLWRFLISAGLGGFLRGAWELHIFIVLGSPNRLGLLVSLLA